MGKKKESKKFFVPSLQKVLSEKEIKDLKSKKDKIISKEE